MNSNKEKSRFLTFLSIIFIVASGIALMFQISEIVMGIEISDFLKEPCKRPDGSSYPGYICFMIKNMRLVNSFLGIVLMSLFISSIGLLMRKIWARKLFLGNLIIGYIFFIILFTANIDISGILILLSIGLLIMWIIKKLITPPLENEFKW